MNLTDANYHWKNWVDWILDTWWDKTLQPQKCTFWEKEPKKLKKHTETKKKILKKTTLSNVALKIEIGVVLQGCLSPL